AEVRRKPPVRCDGRARYGGDSAAKVGVLVEGLAGKPLHLLADIAADHIAEGVAESAGGAGERATRLEGTVERGTHDQGVGPSGDGERSARDGKIKLGRLQQLRHGILRM